MPRRRLIYLLVVVALLGEMAFAMVTTALQQSPTIDEPVYVATSQVLTQQHSLRYNPEHPPLGKLLMAAGLAFEHPYLDPAYNQDQTLLGRHLLYETGNNPFRLMLAARLPMIVLTLAIGLVVLGFARDLADPWGGLVALALYAFSPDVIAHGSLATLDVPAAGMLLTAFWMLWRSRRRPLLYLPLAGVALGAALATRMSALPAVPIVMALALLSPFALRRGAPRSSSASPSPASPSSASPSTASPSTASPSTASPSTASLSTASPSPFASAGSMLGSPPRGESSLGGRLSTFGWRVAGAIGVGLIAVAVVWVVYLAVDPRLRWTTPALAVDPGGLKGLAVDLLPLPKAYRDGVLIQFAFESRTFNGFLLRHAYRGSLWYYAPAALVIKTPLAMMALWLAGVITMLVRPALRVATLYLIVPAGVLMLVAMTGARDYGSRYVIFMPIFGAVVAGTVVLIRLRWARVATAALVGWVAVSSALTFPYYLPYSNEAFGGTSETHRRLHDSNVDWGQDLARLGTRLRSRYPGQPVWLVYKGAGVPSYYGIASRNPLTVPDDQVHGLLVVSDSRVALATGKLRQLIDSSTEIDNVGYSITIYRR